MNRALAVRSCLCLALISGLLAAPPGHASSTGEARPPVGRFDEDGRYRPPPQRLRFRRLHRPHEDVVPHYPVVLSHGIFGFERLRLGPFFADYWVGVVERLQAQGVAAFTTRVTDFEGIAHRAEELRRQVLEVLAETGAEKVNLVAHSMGGLDCRYMITHLGMADRVASLTTVSSPHHGSWYADFCLEWVFEKQRFQVVWDALGIPRGAIRDCTVEYVNGTFNPQTPDMPGVRYFSLGGHQSALSTPPLFSTGTLISNLMEKLAVKKRLRLRERITARLLLPKALRRAVSRPEGPAALGDASWVDPSLAGRNDSLITVSSARWGEYLGTLDADHLDQVGWFSGFDAARFYAGICEMLVDAGF